MNQIQCNLCFVLEGYVIGHSAVSSFLSIILAKPLFWHEQLCRNQTIAFRTGIAYENTHLRVGYFSNTTTILRGHTHRMLAFFKHATFIDGNHSFIFSKALRKSLLINFCSSFIIPFSIFHEMLQITRTSWIVYIFQCNGFCRLPFQMAQQSLEIHIRMKCLLRTSETVHISIHIITKPVSYTHLRAHETRHDLVCRLLLEKKKSKYR